MKKHNFIYMPQVRDILLYIKTASKPLNVQLCSSFKFTEVSFLFKAFFK